MKPEDVLRLAGAAPSGKRPHFFADPDVDRLLAIVWAMAGELAVTRERLDTVERLLESSQALSREAIETYRPDPAAARERGREGGADAARAPDHEGPPPGKIPQLPHVHIAATIQSPPGDGQGETRPRRGPRRRCPCPSPTFPGTTSSSAAPKRRATWARPAAR